MEKELKTTNLFSNLSLIFGCIGFMFGMLGVSYGYMGCGLGLFFGVFTVMRLDEDKSENRSCLTKSIIGMTFSVLSLFSLFLTVKAIL